MYITSSNPMTARRIAGPIGLLLNLDRPSTNAFATIKKNPGSNNSNRRGQGMKLKHVRLNKDINVLRERLRNKN